MDTSIKRERTAVTAIANFYHEELQPHLPCAAMCVFATRITSLVLAKLGITHLCSHLDVTCMNDEMLQFHSAPLEKLPTTANSWLCLSTPGFGSMPIIAADCRPFYGHMVVETDNFFIDLTAHQFDQPKHRIVTGSPLIIPLGSLTEHRFTFSRNKRDDWWSVPIARGHYFFREATCQNIPRTEADWGPMPIDWVQNCLDHTEDALSRMSKSADMLALA
jgi:hypothetical protein